MKKKITIIGPFPPLRSGTTIKNEILAVSLEQKGIEITKINTVNKRIGLFFAILHFSFSVRRRHLIISVSKNGRFFLLPYAYLAKKCFLKTIILMPCGGTMPEELSNMNRLVALIYHRACNSIDMIYVETQTMHNKLKTVLPNAKIEVMFNFKPRPVEVPSKDRASSVIRLVFLGRLRKEKGIFNLIDAVKIILNKHHVINVAMDFYGDFLSCDSEVKIRFLREIAEVDAIKYKGYLNGSDINNCLKNYDVFVFPTFFKSEGFPGVLIDAAYAGLPVIATDIAYNGEIVQHGETGLLYQPENVNSLALAIEELCLNPGKRMRLGKNNWHRSVNYDSSLAASKIIFLFSIH